MADVAGSTMTLLEYGRTSCPGSWAVREARPSMCRIYAICAGGATYTSGAIIERLEPGSLYMLPVDRPYAVSHDPACPLDCLWFHLTMQPPVREPLTGCTWAEHEALAHLVAAANHAVVGGAARAVVASVAGALVTTYMAELGLEASHDPRLAPALECMHGQPGVIPSARALARLCGYSQSHFARVFRATLGATPTGYLLTLRLLHARLLLQQGLSVRETATQVGYDDAKAFSRAFHKHFAVPPSACKSECTTLQP